MIEYKKRKKGDFSVTVIVCISDGGGMMFNKRRQSRDIKIIEDIAALIEDKTLFISNYSAPLFEESSASVIAVSNPLDAAGRGDAAFVEDVKILPHANKISEFVIYKWNRNYPADLSLDISPESLGMTLVSSLDFAGRSHEKVTREIWKG